jgi:subtilisin family serine protease
MLTRSKAKFRASLIVLLTIFSLSSTMVPTTALDLGAKAKYIISVTPAAKAAIEATITKNGWKIDRKYNYVFDGYTVELPKLVAGLLAKIPNVLTVEEDRDVMGLAIQNTQSPTPAWGLDRVDQRQKVGLTGSTSAYGYRSAGAGATIYIGDSGIFPHADFAGRLSTSGFSSINDGNGTVDCNGHGTHVAGTAAGTKYGLAKNARLVPVRLLDCSGSGRYSSVIAALDWILSPENPNPKTQAVVNLSIGGPGSAALNTAILRLTNAGITVVAAAGNESTDACTRSPAGAPSAITVGATTLNDVPASYSNQGKCVDIFAPGSGILSAWIGAPDATRDASGTSMASPHVAGAAAIYLGLNPTASVAQVAQYLDAESTKDVITGLKAETVNKYLYVSPTDGGAPIVAPVVAQKSVTNITHQSADVLIDVNPGFAPTRLSFEYSLNASFTETATATVLPGMVDGGAPTTASVKLTGLAAATAYLFRIIGINESGRTVSETGSFTTLPPPATSPIARIAPATNVTAYSATLNGVAQAGNAPTTVTFVYGTDPEFKVNTNSIAASPFEISGGHLRYTCRPWPGTYRDNGELCLFKAKHGGSGNCPPSGSDYEGQTHCCTGQEHADLASLCRCSGLTIYRHGCNKHSGSNTNFESRYSLLLHI